jgi:hypothetical protein
VCVCWHAAHHHHHHGHRALRGARVIEFGLCTLNSDWLRGRSVTEGRRVAARVCGYARSGIVIHAVTTNASRPHSIIRVTRASASRECLRNNANQSLGLRRYCEPPHHPGGGARLLGGSSHRTNFRFSLSFSGPDKLAHIEIGPVLSVPQTLGEGRCVNGKPRRLNGRRSHLTSSRWLGTLSI